MTDEELVKRLRNAKVTQDFRHTLEDEAADRIEQLVATNEALTAKLAKAVEALREIAGECGCSTARALLAEIEGEKG